MRSPEDWPDSAQLPSVAAGSQPLPLTFADATVLAARQAHWNRFIEDLPEHQVIAWMTGAALPPAAAVREAAAQKDALLAAMVKDGPPAALAHDLPRGGAATERGPAAGHTMHPHSGAGPVAVLTISGYRDYAAQLCIWQRKYEFTGEPFDRISGEARTLCADLLDPGEVRWNPADPRHRACWNGTPHSKCGHTAARTGLSAGQRQREILQASAAPGLSRHHWGSDFDLLDAELDAAHWREGGRYWTAYQWLTAHAATFGFVQPYKALSPGALGYMEERWHWSYAPLAAALLAFARRREQALDSSLQTRWSSEQFSFIRQHWRAYLFS